MDVPILGGPFHGGTIEVPRRTTAGLIMSLNHGDSAADYRLASIDGRVTAVLAELVEDTPPYALRSTIDPRWETLLRSAAHHADVRLAAEKAASPEPA